MEKRVELLLWPVVTDPKAPRTVNIAWIFSTETQHRQPLSRRLGQLLLAAPPALPAHTSDPSCPVAALVPAGGDVPSSALGKSVLHPQLAQTSKPRAALRLIA